MHILNTKIWLVREQKFIDKFIYVASVVYPLTTLPQIIQIFTTKDTSGISLITWVLYIVFTLVFLLYSINKKLLPLTITYVLWLVVEICVVVGLLVYGP